MSYWEDDANFLRDKASTEPDRSTAQRLNDIATDLHEAVPDASYLEDLANKICNWSSERVVPTPEFAQEVAQNLRSIGLALRKDPSQ